MLTLSDIIGKDVSKAIDHAVLQKGKTKDGQEYHYIDLIFKNSWTTRVFLNSDKAFGLLDAVRTVAVSKKSESSKEESNDINENSELPFDV